MFDHLGAKSQRQLNASDSLDAIVGWEKLIAFAQAAQLREIARFSQLRPGQEPGNGNYFAADEIAPAVQWTQMAANNRLVLAQALVEQLPATLNALERGEIDLRKASAVADSTWTLTDDEAHVVEGRVLERARHGGRLNDQLVACRPPAGSHQDRSRRRGRTVRAGQERPAGGARRLPRRHGCGNPR